MNGSRRLTMRFFVSMLAAGVLSSGCTEGMASDLDPGGGGGGGGPANTAGGSPAAAGGTATATAGGTASAAGGNVEPTPEQPDFPRDGFCSVGTASWAFCEDFDGLGAGTRETY